MTERVRAVRAPGQANSVTLSARLHRAPAGPISLRALVTAELVSSDSGYINRPPRHAPARQKHSAQVDNVASRPDILGRAVDRMCPALRAYKQRAQRRAPLHAWLAARAALGGNERYEDEVRTPASWPVKVRSMAAEGRVDGARRTFTRLRYPSRRSSSSQQRRVAARRRAAEAL
jgi:hypothetical protein